MENKNKNLVSELRMDLVSEDWVIVAKGRDFKPSEFKKTNNHRKVNNKQCVFCSLGNKENNNKVIAVFYKGKHIPLNHKMSKHWDVVVIKNKFPAVSENIKNLNERMEDNLYKKMDAFGFHEVVAIRDHKKRIGQMEVVKIKEVIDAYQQRYLSLMKKVFVRYISIFHNSGPSAGASVEHPHSQIITTPLIDKDIHNALDNSKKYYKTRNNCVYCDMIKWEKDINKRIVFENENFIAICPFASRTAFEVIISPKCHLPYFEKITEKEKLDLAESFKFVLEKMDKVLKNPDFNFYLKTSPCDGSSYEYYHWHFAILPKTSIPAGFELGTLMDICTVLPEEAALRIKEAKN